MWVGITIAVLDCKTELQSLSMIVVAVSSQGSGLQPYSLTTVSKVITTMTTSNASSNGVWEGTGGARERMVSTIPAFCGDHGRSRGATGAAFAGEGLLVHNCIHCESMYQHTCSHRQLDMRTLCSGVCADHMTFSQWDPLKYVSHMSEVHNVDHVPASL